MILFDFNQVAIANLMEQIGSSKTPVDESLVRHMILNTIRTYVKKFKESHGPEVVIACDNKKYWRRDVFQTTNLIVRRQDNLLVTIGVQSLKY
jgi:hypothetical protein